MLWQFGELGYDIELNDDRLARKPVPFSNGYSTDADRLELYRITGEMIKLKTKYPETFNSTTNDLDVSGLVKRIQLRGPVFDVVMVANFDLVSKDVAPRFTETGTWYEYFSGTTTDITNQNSLVTIPAGGYRLYSNQLLSTTASISPTIEKQSLQLFPNPATTSFRLNGAVQKVIIYNVTGQIVKQFDTEMESYNVTDLSSGIYLVHALNSENSRSTIKLVKK
jgi:hypothetical protein